MSKFSNSPLPTPEPMQFGLRALMLGVAAVSVWFAIGYWFGPIVFFLLAILIGLCALVWRVQSPGRWLIAALLFAAFFALKPRVGPGPASPRSQCSNNLRQIGLALQGYHNAYGCFPPTYIADASGRPIHSWRVLILPFLEYTPLYKQYDFDEPWDGPHNRLLAKIPIAAYRCPSDKTSASTATSYVAIEGPQTAWGAKIDDVTDRGARTVMVIECDNLGIHWMEPRDLPARVAEVGVDPTSANGMSSSHPGVIQASFADAHVQPLPRTLDRESWSALFTRAGGKTVDSHNLHLK